MKTKAFLLVCLFMGIGLTKLSAQNGKNGNGAVTGYWTWALDQPVYCNGVQIDDLLGSGTFHFINHYKDGVLIFIIGSFDGVYKSTQTDEEFKILSTNEKDIITPVWSAEWHYNIKGNKGSHYIGTLYLDENWNYTIGKAVCVENGPKK
jgi:hypothetical protein